MELDDNSRRLIESYSGGHAPQNRPVRRPAAPAPVLILDEPWSAWTPPARAASRTRAGLRDGGPTIFLSTHMLEIAEQLCDGSPFWTHGQLIRWGTVAELRAALTSQAGTSLESLFLQLTQTETQD